MMLLNVSSVKKSLLIVLYISSYSLYAGDNFMHNGITAHRGNSSCFPENSIPAFQSALKLGADWIEIDVHTTKDGKLVVIHDEDTARVAEKKLVIKEANYDQLAELDLALAFRKKHGLSLLECPSVRLPLLEEVLELMATQNKTRLSIQPKSDCVDEIVALVKKMDLLKFVGFNDGSLLKMKRVKTLVPSAPVFWDRAKESDVMADIQTALSNNFEAMILHESMATPQNLRLIKEAGLEAGVWTVNGSKNIERFLKDGAMRIYTDTPEEMAKILVKRKTP